MSTIYPANEPISIWLQVVAVKTKLFALRILLLESKITPHNDIWQGIILFGAIFISNSKLFMQKA